MAVDVTVALPGGDPGRFLRNEPDDALVELAGNGNVAAFEAIYDRHYRGLIAFCRHMLWSREEAEDALQHTFAAAYRALTSGGERPNALKPWLYTIARNRCLTVLRTRRTRDAVDADAPADGAAVEGLADAVQRRAELRDLVDDLHRLPEDQRAALVLFELGDHSHAEIAAVLAVDRTKVKALVFQAREGLLRARTARDTPCAEIRKHLSSRARALPRRGVIRGHLEACPACAAFDLEVRRQRAALALVLPVVPSLELKGSVLGPLLGGGATVASGGAFIAGGGAGAGAGIGASGTTATAGLGAASAGTGAGVSAGAGGAALGTGAASGIAGAGAAAGALAAKAVVAKVVAVVAVAGAAAGGSVHDAKPVHHHAKPPAASSGRVHAKAVVAPSAVRAPVTTPAVAGPPAPTAGAAAPAVAAAAATAAVAPSTATTASTPAPAASAPAASTPTPTPSAPATQNPGGATTTDTPAAGTNAPPAGQPADPAPTTDPAPAAPADTASPSQPATDPTTVSTSETAAPTTADPTAPADPAATEVPPECTVPVDPTAPAPVDQPAPAPDPAVTPAPQPDPCAEAAAAAAAAATVGDAAAAAVPAAATTAAETPPPVTP